MRTIITIENLTKIFPKMDRPALDIQSLKIESGQMTGIVGPDGAGKTTLLRLLVGLMMPTSGIIEVLDFNTTTNAQNIHENSGYMPQKFGLYEDLTVIQNLNLYADLRSVFGERRIKKFEQLLKFTNLEKFQDRLAGKLSGGMKQKLGLACALISDPKVLFLDEPSVGVDPISHRELLKMVKDLLEDDITILWSTSYLDEAELCDKVILLNEERIIFKGAPSDLLKNIDNRVWVIKTENENDKRNILTDILKNKDIIDGVIEEQHLRIVLNKENNSSQFAHHSLINTKPRFEDGFMDILGGITTRSSILANEIKHKPDDNKIVINAQNLRKEFGNFVAVKNSNFQVSRGEIFGLLGPNGAGKSTIFKMMCGLLTPTSGNALVDDLDLKTPASKARSKIGYVAQKFSLYGQLSVMQNLKFFSGAYGLSNHI